MVLPINTKPSIISDVQHAFPLAIIEQEIDYSLISFSLNINTEEFTEEITNDVRFIKHGNYMEIRNKKYSVNTECFTMKECAANEDVVLEISGYRKDVRQDIFCLIITGEEYVQAIQSKQNIFRIGLEGEEIFYGENEKIYYPKKKDKDLKCCKKIRLTRNKNLLTYYVMQENKWKKLYSTELTEDMLHQKLYIGIYGNWGEIQYYNWKYMNYLQLVYDEKDERIWLDYFMYPKKGKVHYYFQQFLNSSMIPQKEICEVFSTVSKGVLWFIQHGYYVEIMLNSPNSSEKYPCRNNLLYGYSKDEAEIYALEYEDSLRFSIVNRYDLDKYIEPDEDIRIYEYAPNNKNMSFRMQRFIQTLEQFIEGKNSGLEYDNILASGELVYGMKIFERIANHPKSYDILQNTPQIVNLLCEHSCLMEERLEFFFHRKYISEEGFKKLKCICSELVEQVKCLKQLVLEKQTNENGSTVVTECFKELCKKARLFYGNLLETLKSTSNE